MEGLARTEDPSVVLAANSAFNILNFRMNLVESLRRLGARPVAFVPPGGERELEAAGVPVVTVPMKADGTSPVHDLMLLRRYWTSLRKERPAAFLGFTAKPNIYGSLAAASLGIPAINNITGLGTAFIHGGLLDAIASLLYRLALARSCHVLFHNPDDLNLFVERRLVAPDRATVIPGSGVNLERFGVAPLPGKDQRITFLFIGRLLWEKGVGEFAAAARALRPRFPGARFQVLGAIDDGRRGVPQETLDGWLAEGSIEYLGTTNDVRPAIAGADCLVLPSYREGMPRVLLEAAAMGRPLIASDAPGCRHIVEDGINGFLATVRSADALADAMKKIIEASPETRRAIGQAARSMIEARFSEAAVEEVYTSLLIPFLKTGQPRHA